MRRKESAAAESSRRAACKTEIKK